MVWMARVRSVLDLSSSSDSTKSWSALACWKDLPVLADHDERRQEDRLRGYDEGEAGPGAGLHEQHPADEDHRVEIDEWHGAGELGDRIGDAQLDVRCAADVMRDHHWMVFDQVGTAH